MEKNLYIDMDGCLAEFIVLDQSQQYRLYEKGYFLNLRPQESVIEGLRYFMPQHPEINCFILSAYLRDSKWALQEKIMWLDRFFPELEESKRYFVPCGCDKSIVTFENEKAFLLEDHSPNLQQWVSGSSSRKGIKLINPINGSGRNWKGDRIRYDLSPEKFSEELFEIITA